MIREDRDLAFWTDVFNHPAVRPHVSMDGDLDWLPALVASERVTPLRTDGGGFLFLQLDALGRTLELHAAFLPEAWGAQVSQALKAALTRLEGWDLIVVSEVAGNWRSRPPRSFGFRPAAEMAGQFRTWTLTRAAWEQSPARRRME